MRDVGRRREPAVAGRTSLLADDPDPQLLQTWFLAVVALAFGLARVSGTTGIDLRTWPTVGAALTLVGCVVSVAVPWERVPRVLVALLPLLDIAALGFARLDSAGSGAAGILVVMPALWLGWMYGRPGALVATLGVFVLAALPALLYFGNRELLARTVLITVVSGAAALVLAASMEKVRAGTRIAEKRGAELAEALRMIELQRRFADAILDTVDVGLVLLDRNGTYRSVNKRHEDFLRLAFPHGHTSRAGQLGLIFEADGRTVFNREGLPTHRAAQGEEFDDLRIWVGSDPLTMRALSVSARSVLDDRGAFAGAALAYTDVTEFMRVLQVKDEFIASVSHELRTPLTSIVGYAQLLRERDDLNPEVVAQLEVISRSSARLQRLVADLLHTAESDEGPMHVTRVPSDLSDIVRAGVQCALPMAEAVGTTLELDVPDSLSVLVDPQRMAQVVDNLVTNALKYTPPGGRVVVSLEVDGDRVELAVADNGVGIDVADRERLFSRFFRARQAEEQSIQGVGLGLSITKSIVESHGGRIEVESEVGRGSVFRIRLPYDGGAATPARLPADAGVHSSSAG
ncbi:MAG: ATP-binding region, ATPase domain protein [Nocardioides sp.]|nr:ATP-binding region, ATPase domain protein [Nocardioides sp.]